MYRSLVRVVMKCSKLEQIKQYKGKYDISPLEFKQLVEETRNQFTQLNGQELNSIIDLMRQDQLVDNENANFLLTAIKDVGDPILQHQLLDKIILPTVNLSEEQLRKIESILEGSKETAIALSIYGKMHVFYEYQNKQIMNQFVQIFDVSKQNAEQLGAAAIGLALGQYKEKNLWEEISKHCLSIQKDFHSYMRIATGMGLTNNGNEDFWNDFKQHFLLELKCMNEDIFTQSLQVISQQNIVNLSECELEIENYILKGNVRIENMMSIYVSMARKQLGTQKLYSKLQQDIYEMNLSGDDLMLYVLELMQVKDRIADQTLNVLVAKAYSESQNQELIDKLAKIIKGGE